MKKQIILLFIVVLTLLNSGFSQIKPKPSWMQQEFIETGREMKAERKKIECGAKIDTIVEYLQSLKDTCRDMEFRRMRMYKYAYFSCPQMISFYEQIILTDTSFMMRDDALLFLGWVDAQSSIPFLLEYYKNPNLSKREKIRIGITLSVIGDHDNATKILDENCYDSDKDICRSCYWAYYRIWNKSSLKYYRYLFKSEKNGDWGAALTLAEMGDMRTVYNYFKEQLKTPGDAKKITMEQLAKIGDKKSIKLIEGVFKNHEEDMEIRTEALLLMQKNKSNKQKVQQRKRL